MKKIYSLTFIFFFSFFYSQCDCAKNFGGHIDDATIGIEKVSNGFLYSFSNGTSYSSADYINAGEYIVKFDFNCNRIWYKSILNDTFTVDSSDNIYTLTADGYYQNYRAYVRKYDPTGVLIWEKIIKDAEIGGNIPKHLFVRDNKLFVVGTFWHDINFEDKVIFHYDFQHFGGNRAKAFVASYYLDGQFIDAKQFGNGLTEAIQNFEIDDNANTYITLGDRNFSFSKIIKINSNLQTIIDKTVSTESSDPTSWGYVPTVLHFNKLNSKLYSYGLYLKSTNIGSTLVTDSSNDLQALIVEYEPNTLEVTRYLKFNNNSWGLDIPSDEGNTAPLFLNRIYFAEENTDEMYIFGHFQKSLNLNGTQLTGHADQYGGYGTDLVFFKLDTKTFIPEFIFQSTSTDLYSSRNVAKGVIMSNGRIYLAGNMGFKKMALNGTVINNNSGNGDADAFLFRYDVNNTIGTLQSNSPVCIGKNIELTASGGTSYLWSGPNNFSSTLQNPKILNASTTNSGDYSCIITGSGSCAGTFTTNVLVGDHIKPAPNLATLPKITGDCKILVSTIPTATDNCKGQITATTTDPLSYSLPGNYIITWKYDDGNGNIETQTQQVEITPQPLPIANAIQPFCKIDNKRISDIAVIAINPKWYDANGNVITNLSEVLVDNTKYYVTQNSSGCESAKKEILITLSDPNPPTGLSIQKFCSASNPIIDHISIAGTNILWYNSLTASAPIPGSTPLQDGQTYYASQTISTCESTQKLAVTVNIVTNYLSANDYSETFCNDTTSDNKIINIDNYKKEMIANPQDYRFEIRNNRGELVSGDTSLDIGTNIFDVKIKSSLGCYQEVKLKLTLNRKPKIDLRSEEEFCDDILGVSLDAGYDPNPLYTYTYNWNSGETSQTIKADQEKTYTVIVTSNFGCQNTASVIVKKAKLAEIQNVLITNGNNANIIMSFAGDYLYSLNRVNWQSSNRFEGLENGNYTVYVKTNLGCDLGFKSFTLFSLSNIFSPNGDGNNDTWKISGIESYPNSEIKIFDRNGKILINTITKGEPFEWDGKINGHKLPTDSYWYQIKISDGRILEGYVVIKNRN